VQKRRDLSCEKKRNLGRPQGKNPKVRVILRTKGEKVSHTLSGLDDGKTLKRAKTTKSGENDWVTDLFSPPPRLNPRRVNPQ